MRRKLRIWSHLLKKSLRRNFYFWAVLFLKLRTKKLMYFSSLKTWWFLRWCWKNYDLIINQWKHTTMLTHPHKLLYGYFSSYQDLVDSENLGEGLRWSCILLFLHQAIFLTLLVPIQRDLHPMKQVVYRGEVNVWN